MKKYYFISASVLALVAQPAFAQSTEDGISGSNIIIVTAQKREQNIQDVPLSITAVGGDKLAASGVVDVSRLDQLVTGLQLGQSGADARPAIRGARTDNISNQQDPVIGFFVDGIYRSRTSQALAAFVDVDRVEVLRGPQGTLYGRNTFGGAINIISKAPVNDLKFGVNATIGNYSQRRVDGFFNAPLSDTLAVRVSASIDSHDGYVENTFNPAEDLKDKDESYVRLQLKWEPSDVFDVTIRGSKWRQNGNGSSDFGYYNAGTPINPGGGVFTYAEVLTTTLNPINPRVGAGLNTPSDRGPYSIARDADFSLKTDQETLDAEVNYDLGFAAAKLLVGYADFTTTRTADADLSIKNSGTEGQIDSAETFSQELQLSSTFDGPLQFTVGAFHLTDKTQGIFLFDRVFNTDAATNLPILTSPAPNSDFNSLANVDTESLAFFGQGTFSLSDAFRLTGGVRWTRDKKDFDRQTNGTFTVPIVFNGTVFRDSAVFKKVTWKGGAEFDVTPDNLLYASASTGFQAGGFNNSADAVTGGASFGPQTVTAYEIGSKNSFADNRVTLNIALFQNDFSNLLANASVNVGPPSNTVLTISTNAGAARARGAEATLAFAVNDDFDVNLQGSYNNAKFGTYLVREPITGAAVDLVGQRVPLQPKLTLGLGTEYRIETSSSGRIVSRGNLYYSSSYFTSDNNYAFARQGSYAKVDLSLTYESPNDTWYVQAFGRNLTDKAVANRTVIFGQNAIAQNFSDPLTFGIRLGFKN